MPPAPQRPQLDFARLEALFHGALELPAEERERFLLQSGAEPELLAELRALLAADDPSQGLKLPAEALEALAAEGLAAGPLPRLLGPYRLLRVAGQGGMGLVYEAERADGTFEGRLAIKMLRPGPLTRGLVERFLMERRTLARLEHPGIARLLDAGADEQGSPWLALEFVRGERIDRYCDGKRLGLTARLKLFVEVTAAVAHAHEQLVVHRDLKPDNILVADTGRVRLLDFGIAKVLDPEAEDPGLTLSGDRALTPAYASPEQLAGQAVLPRSDVYSLGLVLFELLCGRSPYRGETHNLLTFSRLVGEARLYSPLEALEHSPAGQAEIEAIAARRSTRPSALRRALRGDLARICALALHSEPERRYASAGDFRADLERFLAGQPVRATPDSWAYRVRRWAKRHRAESLLLALLFCLSVIFGAQFVRQGLRSQRQLLEIQQLGDAEELANLERQAQALWPATPARGADFLAWIQRATALLERRPLHAENLARLLASERLTFAGEAPPETQTGGQSWPSGGAPSGLEPSESGQQSAAAQASNQPAPGYPRGGLKSVRERDFAAWRGARLAELLAGLDRLEEPDPFANGLASVQARLKRAQALEQRSLQAPAEAWTAAKERLAADPRFFGFSLEPLLGLVPLGRDPSAGLEAFLVLDTGLEPAREDDGQLIPTPESGLVLLLLPGARALLGAQSETAEGPHFDPAAEADEAPLFEVELEPFLLSKFELTQAQWERLTGENPSDRKSGPLFPVDRVHWQRAREILARYELGLPSEAQWEYAARAGTHSVFYSGTEAQSLNGHANLADAFAQANGGSSGWTITAEVEDGFTLPAPVGSFAANPFGLCDMLGNVWEWVDDLYLPYDLSARPADGRRLPTDPAQTPEQIGIVARGGSYMNAAPLLRCAERYRTSPTNESRSTGIRPARRAR